MNPSANRAEIDRAYAEDPQKAAAEYGAEFRSDLAAFVDRDVVEQTVVAHRHELPRASGVEHVAFVDPSGGSSDSMTLAIAHRDRQTGRGVLDLLREVRAPFSPEAAVQEFAGVLKSYRLHRVVGDHYAGEWPRERFRICGIDYTLSDQSKSTIYQNALPLLNSGRVELLDNSRLIAQICALERRTARGGRDSIDHPPNAHDDLANSALGALVLAAANQSVVISDEVLQRARQYTRSGFGRRPQYTPALDGRTGRPLKGFM